MFEPHTGHCVGITNSRASCRTAVEQRAHHFGNHVAGAPHDHRVADADILAAHFVFVVQRGIRDRRAADEHRLQPRHRRDRAGAADLHVDRDEFGQRFLRGKFVRQRKTRRARHEAERVLLVAPVDLVDHAVDVVRQRLALLADRVEEAQQAFGALHHRPFAVHRQAEFLVPVEQFAMRGRHLDAFEHADAISEKRQRPLRGDLRIELPQTARRGVARIGEFLLLGRALAFVQTLEIALEHQHFAAHVEHAAARVCP